MCGIFGLLSTPGARVPVPGHPFFDAVSALTRLGAEPIGLRVEDLDGATRSAILARVEVLQRESYRWMEREPFLAALSDVGLQVRLRSAASAISDWTRRLEGLASHAGLTRQRDWEFINRLIVAGKDIAWQLDRDLLGNFAPTLDLLGEESASDGESQALAHAWQLNLMLTSLNRLEVRGRDSAGFAAYLFFPSPESLDGFLDGPGGKDCWRHDLDRRSLLPALTHGAVVRPATSGAALLAVFKVANEVGKMGDNAAFLREAIAKDRFFQAAIRFPGVQMQCLAHTRWASNGIISLANCHPVDSAAVRASTGRVAARGEIVAVLNGDVDNYLALVKKHVHEKGLRIEEGITTDAKIIPLVVADHYRESCVLSEAFRAAFAEFEGSMAIGVMAADHPGEFLFGQKGSGQGLFLGLTEHAVVIASEMYGIVEHTPRNLKADGERVEGGEIFHLVAQPDSIQTCLWSGPGGPKPLPAKRVRTAEITTRDIHRGEKPHFFLKEIGESVESVGKTLRGKFDVSGGKVRFHLGSEVLSEDFIAALRSGKIRQVDCIGQGTAAIAAEGIAHLLESALRGARPPLRIVGMKATELSGHHLREDMSDTLVVAVSQSGTTTDTNRTVDMARERGAHIIAIVNRRNSDLVYKSSGVLYTSDGRDIEMSVASTKAFYAQTVAGQILSLALASELRTLDDAEIAEAARELERLPAAMARVLELDAEVNAIASRFAVERRHWAIVGSGAGKIAADEIRIKLSELCYKSIAVDYLEDKKHIDLSSEPLVVVCAAGVPAANVSDLVKEVAIFKAHKSIPIVIADEGEGRFDPYAAGTIHVPAGAGSVGYLLTTMVGHLLGYHAAAAFDRMAEQLREVRAEVLATLTAQGQEWEPGKLPERLTEKVVEMESAILAGRLDAAINPGMAARLHRALEVLLGRLSLQVFSRERVSVTEGILASLSEAISELSRPIDAIKHQAKTVTVGISRGEAPAAEGVLLSLARDLGLDPRNVAEGNSRFVVTVEPLVASVEGSTLYRIQGLDPLGRPTESATIHVVKKTGCAAGIPSRSESPTPLVGTKWGVLKSGEFWMGRGEADGRKILMLPVAGEGTDAHLLLYHLELVPRGRRETRLRALKAWPGRYERIKCAVTERNAAWDDDLLDGVDNDVLFFDVPEAAAEEILQQHRARVL